MIESIVKAYCRRHCRRAPLGNIDQINLQFRFEGFMIEVTIALVKLSSIGSSYVTPQHLARELNNLLIELGNSEFSQARKALTHAELSTKPERELTLAIGHLQSADGHFEQALNREMMSAGLYTLTSMGRSKRYIPPMRMRILCKATIATIYGHLNQPQLVQQYADEISEAFNRYHDWALIAAEGYYVIKQRKFSTQYMEDRKETTNLFRVLGVTPFAIKEY